MKEYLHLGEGAVSSETMHCMIKLLNEGMVAGSLISDCSAKESI
jgi:hypothetical protein